MYGRPVLDDLVALAREAGAILREGYHQPFNVDHKGEVDLVTEVDRRSEAYLLQQIHTRFPGDSIVAEESGGNGGGSDRRWYIDPLDGTTNFTHRLPIFSVSIAYAVAGEVQLGVVYNPIHEELFSAQKGAGAWLNGEPIQVAGQTSLRHSLLVTGFPYDRASNPDNNLNYFNYFAPRCQGIRRLGSAALDLCYVACGRVDGYWEIRLEAWDLAAGMLIAREAGAIVSKRDGDTNMLQKPYSVVAGNPDIHGLLIAGIAAVDKK